MSDRSTFLERLWYGNVGVLNFLLMPISTFQAKFQATFQAKLQMLGAYCARRRGVSSRFAAPVVVIGNLTVGGTGKTPFLIHLARRLTGEGFNVGVVSRGYRSKKSMRARAGATPHCVDRDDTAAEVGDEVVLIHEKTDCPVVIGTDRAAAVRQLLDEQARLGNTIDVVLSDDGLQHYSMHRDIEIAMIDGERLLGNGLTLPAGPLREPIDRLNRVDFIVLNGGEKNHFRLKPTGFVNVRTGEEHAIEHFAGQTVHACAGIGNPGNFFRSLESLDIKVIRHAFRDHAKYTEKMFQFTPRLPVIMTEKDMVKCRAFHNPDEGSGDNSNLWALQTKAIMNPKLELQILEKIRKNIQSTQ